MGRLNTLAKQVEQILEEYPIARNDDRFLVTAVYSKYIDVDMPFRQVMKDYTLPPFESIRRSRQRVQEGREDLRGDKAVEEIRMKLQEEYIAFARGEEE